MPVPLRKVFLSMQRQNKRNQPVGVFDSGLGGLTVVKELIRQLPGEDIIYYGDTARVPYGTKSKESIVRFSRENAKVLFKHKVKMIVVACNSSSSYALPALKKRFHLPIVGVIEPGAKKAIELTKLKKIGVIATSATVKSRQYEQTVKSFDSSMKVYSKACPLFVPLVEEGWFSKKPTTLVALEYLSHLKSKGIDTLILGCTHYPLLKNTLKKILGKKVRMVDSARETASEVRKILNEHAIRNLSNARGKYKFYVNDRPQEFTRIAKQFLGMDVNIKVKRNV